MILNMTDGPTGNDETLTTISIKVPRWVEDELIRICRCTGLDISKAARTELIELAKITKTHFKRGPALEPFLEHLQIQTGQYNLFFERRR